MTAAEFRAHRDALGLSASEMSRALRLGAQGGRTIRRWESGESPVLGPAAVAVELMLAARLAQPKRRKAEAIATAMLEPRFASATPAMQPRKRALDA